MQSLPLFITLQVFMMIFLSIDHEELDLLQSKDQTTTINKKLYLQRVPLGAIIRLGKVRSKRVALARMIRMMQR